jgi:molybdopterin biosynthesis enzyme
LREAAGLIAADDIIAPRNLPEHAVALIDGFAVEARATSDASAYAPIPLNASPVRLDAGETVPPGFDAIAPLDAIEFHNGIAQSIAQVTSGDGILSASADTKAGQVLCQAGRRIRSTHLLAASLFGIETVNVRRPNIALVHAGGSSKSIPAFQLIGSILRATGVNVITADLNSAIMRADANAVIAVGGTGTGRDDASVTALANTGRIVAHGIGISPGETTAFGFHGARPVLLLSGHADAAMAAWLTLGCPLLRALTGATGQDIPRRAKLNRKVTSTIGMADIVPVRYDGEGVEPLASGYWPIDALARAEGWIAIPAQSEGYPEGSVVEVRDFP